MRAIAGCFLALSLIASPVFAGANGAGANGTAANNTPDPSTTSASSTAPESTAAESEVLELRALIEAQAQQMAEQQKELKAQQSEMLLLKQQLTSGSSAALNAVSAPAANAIAAAVPASAAISSTASVPAQAPATDQPQNIKFKGITLTPSGFFAGESVWRQKALASDINTAFGGVPMPGASAAHISEFNASGRQSRIAMLASGKVGSTTLSGYYETDFLSAGTTSNNNQSNSYTNRQRQFWGQVAWGNGVTLTAGQQWSLLTETATGMNNRTENLPMVIDAQYNIGFSWARQYGVRVTKKFGNKFWLGASVEESQATLTTHGNLTAQAATTPLTCTTPGVNGCSAGGTITINTNPTFNNFLLGAFGAGGGLYNPLGNYQFNPSPDIVVKTVWEPGFGHYEAFGVFSEFRDRVFPCVQTPTLAGCIAANANNPATAAFGARNDDRTGGGAGVNARWALFNKKVDFGVHFFGGSGIGRYGSAGLPDATTRPDGTLALLRNYQTLGTLQLHPTPKLDIYFNVGAEYSDHAGYIKSGVTANEGYGAAAFSNNGCYTETLPLTGPATNSNTGVPTGVGGSTGFIPGPLANCTADTRNIIEGTVGFWYRLYNGPMGRFQYGMQYSNYVKNTWHGAAAGRNGDPAADENMVFTSF